ncbi:MAG: TetR/AcrR family transcriptional regulator [Desulfovibrionaceae bacterium]|nr:TetR/AcrR family transcriptional regulator [Desulfovibrionaceae bacterium]
MTNKRQDILLAAQELFGRQGYAGTTMKMIAEKAGVAFGLVAHYFGTKEELFVSAGFEVVDRIQAAMRNAAARAGTGLDAVRGLMQAYLDFTLNNRDVFPVVMRCSPFSEVETLVRRERITEKFRGLFSEIEKAVRRGIEDRSIREMPPREASFLVFACILGTVRTRFLTSYDLPGLYAESLDFVINSLAARPGGA